ncbi:hypothetical protein [Serratia ureilytica]|uniref:hypothetical protein n=1 Tax=Serratia ureilytica TaxID=300181 RepID=UPI001D19249A|nr:hypothetical protein [Serratia ureilytica]MCC4105653.1 hypothetical protein [Serratia ureilytica]
MKETSLLLKSAYADGTGGGHCSYEVEDALGRCFTGTLDANGEAEVVGLAPTDTFAPENDCGVPQWPVQPPKPVRSCRTQAILAEVMTQAQPQTDSMFRPIFNSETREKIKRWQALQENGNAGGREVP